MKDVRFKNSEHGSKSVERSTYDDAVIKDIEEKKFKERKKNRLL